MILMLPFSWFGEVTWIYNIFKPWRKTDELKNGFNTYAETFLSLEAQLTEAVQYHERMTDMQEARDHIKQEIEKNVLNTVEQEENDQGDHP